MASAEKSLALSSAVLRTAKFEQAGEDTAPNRWTVIWYSSTVEDNFPSGHHRKRRKEQSGSGTLTWWNSLDLRHYCHAILTKSCKDTQEGICEIRIFQQQIIKTFSLVLRRTVEDYTYFSGIVWMVNPMLSDEPCLALIT